MEILILSIDFNYTEIVYDDKKEYPLKETVVKYKAFDDDNEIEGEYKNPESYRPDKLRKEIAESLKKLIVRE